MICNKCQIDKANTEFSEWSPGKLRTDCKLCHAASRRQYRIDNAERVHAVEKKSRQKNSEKRREYARRSWRPYRLKKDFNMTLDDYNNMFAAQGGVCAICSNPEQCGKNLSVDHDHKTGKVRQLLCNKCNVGLGSFSDSPESLAKAIQYLLKHSRN